MINLYEYQNKVSYESKEKPIDVDRLEAYLEGIWKNREKSSYFRNEVSEEVEDKVEEQRFLQILKKDRTLKSNKYVGVIHFEGHRINLLPKISYHSDDPTHSEVKSTQLHILWWLSYCDRIRFPSFDSSLSSIDSDFFEILIYLFAKYTRELLSSAIYQQYQEVDRELSFVKGRINMNRYINENLSRGRWHKVNCTYDSFEMDNTFNRVIKYVASLLLSVSKNTESQNYLRDIFFILDEVSDQVMTVRDCASLTFNPMFSDFEKVRDYCQLFLDHSISFDYKKNLKLFAFLIPMEVLFEDFITGFIREELSEVVKMRSQVSNGYLAKLEEKKHFTIKPDLLFQRGVEEIIGDTKYKILDPMSTSPKFGISQSDMYQMVSYAIRLNINKVVLIYPQAIWSKEAIQEKFTITDELAGEDISIHVCEVPMIKHINDESTKDSLNEIFRSLKDKLMDKLKATLHSI